MGHRATFVPIKDQADLTAFALMPEAIETLAEYDAGPYCAGFCIWRGKLYGLFGHDGSTLAYYYHNFSPTFRHFKWLDDLMARGLMDRTPDGSRIRGATYLDTWAEAEAFLANRP